jgi:hypothetical protein
VTGPRRRLSAVMLSWKRPDNVRRIVDAWQADGLVDDAIVWNNNPGTTLTHPWATVVNASHDLGLYTRFAAVALARHRAVLVQDDDVLLPASTVAALHDRWRRQPRVLHGLFGRGALPDGSYGRHVVAGERAPVVLTRALLTHRDHAGRFLAAAGHFAEVQRHSSPQGNGEDIIFSFVARAVTGRRHWIHDLPHEELPAPDAIHQRDWADHLAHRTRVLHAAQEWYDAQRASVAAVATTDAADAADEAVLS